MPEGTNDHRRTSRQEADNPRGLEPARNQLVLPDNAALKRSIMEELHDTPAAGHPGVTRTVELISRYYWWPGMYADVNTYVAQCPKFQHNKSSQQGPVPVTPLPVPVRKWYSVSMDFVTCLPRSGGHDAILVIVDRLTKMCKLVPTTIHVSAPRVLSQTVL